ncbi:MAG: hypothetical protein EB824_00680 [Thaumarchaeota archaeon S15]|nr:MAG: hypothetical protein EB824_00680 [Thaumarchaeota archaeon S15]
MDGVTERRARQEAAAGQDAGRGGTAHADQLYGEILGILNINGRTAAELDAELDRKVAIHAKARDAVTALVPLAERDASRREELFGAIRKAVALSAPLGNLDAELVVLMVTVLLDAGRPVELSEVLRRIRERWGGRTTESALYSAKSSGAIRADMYGVLYLQRPIGDGEGMGEGWMYDAMERAVELGAARYTDNGIEMTGAAAALTERELAAAEAVARGITEYGAPPGLPEWLAREDHGDARRITWAEATVYAQAARAEVGAAWADIAKRRGLERPAAAVWDREPPWAPPEEDPLDVCLPLHEMGDRWEAIAGARAAVTDLARLAARGSPRRDELLGAVREAVALSRPAGSGDAEAAALMVAVLLDAGGPVEENEVYRRVRERWGRSAGRSALQAAMSCRAIRVDGYGVLYLAHDMDHDEGMGEPWMYAAMERAVALGAARYTDGGIEMTGAAAALTERELAGAEAVARGINSYGAPPGLVERLEKRRAARRVTWAEATVAARAAEAEVGAAWEQMAKERPLAPAVVREG